MGLLKLRMSILCKIEWTDLRAVGGSLVRSRNTVSGWDIGIWSCEEDVHTTSNTRVTVECSIVWEKAMAGF